MAMLSGISRGNWKIEVTNGGGCGWQVTNVEREYISEVVIIPPVVGRL
jgi:hypothetical protein